MIDVYSWPTPNGHKVHIALEECGLRLGRDWRVHPIDIGRGEQFTPEFLRISPNNKIPAIVDADGPHGKPIALFESGAILLYLASKTGKLLPRGERQRWGLAPRPSLQRRPNPPPQRHGVRRPATMRG